MSKSNKIIITLGVVALLIISLIVGLVVVFAEEQQPIVRNVNVSYKVVDANCSVSASYVYGDAASNIYLGSKSFTTSGVDGDDDVLEFGLTNKFIEKTLKPTADIALTKENNSVIFEFKFANSGEEAFNATLLLKNEKKSNVVVSYSKNGSVWSGSNTNIDVEGKTGEFAGTASYFVKISLNDVNKGYNYSVDFEWKIFKLI